ncbi:glycosyltransferase [Agrobacterium vitis]
MKIISKVWKRAKPVVLKPSIQERYNSLITLYKATPTEAYSRELERLFNIAIPFEDVMFAIESEFDAAHYLLVNPDVRVSGIEPVFHYLMWGWREHRAPSKFFDPHFYEQRYPSTDPKMIPLVKYALSKSKGQELGNPISNHMWFEPFTPSEEMWRRVKPAVRTAETRAVVVLPVYKGLEETLTSVYAALRARGDDPYSLLIVNDKSPDEALAGELRRLASKGLFDFYDSEVNRGFVRTINYAIEHLTDGLDVVLLNSDAYVNDGWFGRLISHADNDIKVATITPLSNNATICSYPLYDKDNFLALEVTPKELDELAATANKGLSVETPTGVGFCFYMRRAVINELGSLDADSFLVGYGEENDFCMRALNAGYRNLIAGDVFVFHTGSVSFSAIKEENFSRGQDKLNFKHPNYDYLVRHHVKVDPEHYLRRNIDGARLVKAFSGATVIVTHKWSGGIETYLRQLKGDLQKQGRKVLFMRVHDMCHVSFEDVDDKAIFLPNLTGLDLKNEWDFVAGLLKDLKPELFHVNSFAGLSWHYHRQIVGFLGSMACDIRFVGHDYAPISHNYQLIRPDGIYDGIPDVGKLQSWLNMKPVQGACDVCDPVERIDTYRVFFSSSNVTVEVPSASTREIYEQFFPAIEKLVVNPHADHLPKTVAARRLLESHNPRIAIIGAIGFHKGSGILSALAKYTKARDIELEFHLIGYSDDDASLAASGVHIHGAYRTENDALQLLDKLQPDVVFIPSIWPETFCYTLSLAMKKRIPTVAFDLGAQAERLSNVEWGTTIPIELALDPGRLAKTLLDLPLDELWQHAYKPS